MTAPVKPTLWFFHCLHCFHVTHLMLWEKLYLDAELQCLSHFCVLMWSRKRREKLLCWSNRCENWMQMFCMQRPLRGLHWGSKAENVTVKQWFSYLCSVIPLLVVRGLSTLSKSWVLSNENAHQGILCRKVLQVRKDLTWRSSSCYRDSSLVAGGREWLWCLAEVPHPPVGRFTIYITNILICCKVKLGPVRCSINSLDLGVIKTRRSPTVQYVCARRDGDGTEFEKRGGGKRGRER